MASPTATAQVPDVRTSHHRPGSRAWWATGWVPAAAVLVATAATLHWYGVSARDLAAFGLMWQRARYPGRYCGVPCLAAPECWPPTSRRVPRSGGWSRSVRRPVPTWPGMPRCVTPPESSRCTSCPRPVDAVRPVDAAAMVAQTRVPYPFGAICLTRTRQNSRVRTTEPSPTNTSPNVSTLGCPHQR